MTNWCCLCNSDPCDCMARVQRKKDAARAVEQMCRDDGERELTTLRTENERLTQQLADFRERAVKKNKYILACNDKIAQLKKELADAELANRVLTLAANELERVRRERDEARAAIESDRTKLADSVTAIDKALDSRFWLTEGRGSYAWDDNRYRQEFRDAATEILSAIKALRSLAADWSNSPMSGEEVAQARIDLKAERDQLREQLAAAQKDSERIDWLEADMPTSLIAWMDAASGCRLVQAGDSRGIGQDVRSAIDAARAL